MTTHEKEKFVDALIKARHEASLVRTNDSGTCNFDTCVVSFKEMHTTYKVLEQLVKAANLRSYKLESPIWRGCAFVMGYELGQADRRTRMVETFRNTLADNGFPCTVFYEMD